MKNARSLAAAVVLTFVVAISGLAAPPCTPGQIDTPPCAMAPAATPGQTDTPPIGKVSLTEIASSVLLSILSLF